MFGSSHASTRSLMMWCRALHHGLSVGFSPGKVLRQQAQTGPPQLRTVAARVADRLDEGDSLTDALKPEIGRFPVLFLESIAVGEQTGRLADILAELEKHYENLRTVQQGLKLRLIWPLMSLSAAVLVVALLMAIAGELIPGYDPIGLGLTGISGALIFLVLAGAIAAAIVGAVWIIAHDEPLKARVLGIGMRVPWFNDCIRSFALQRFALAFHFLSEAGLKADRTLATALRATANRVYRAWEQAAAKAIRQGKEIAETLALCGPRLFPEEFIESVRIAEETGRLAEVMHQQSRQYAQESERRLRTLSMLTGAGVYLLVALLIIATITRLLLVIFGGAAPGGGYDSLQQELKILNKMAGIPD